MAKEREVLALNKEVKKIEVLKKEKEEL